MNAAIPIAAVLAVRNFLLLLEMELSQCLEMIYEQECMGGDICYFTSASFLLQSHCNNSNPGFLHGDTISLFGPDNSVLVGPLLCMRTHSSIPGYWMLLAFPRHCQVCPGEQNE